jgi:hypothetical protein
MRRGPAVLAAKPGVPVLDGALKRVRIGDQVNLYHHTILSGGELIGVWEYDPQGERAVTRVWNSDMGLRRRVDVAAAETGRFIREQLGDAKLSAVDPPEKHGKRLAFCRGK